MLALALAGVVSGCGSTTTSTVNSGTVIVTVTSPTSGSVIEASNVTVRGTVDPANAVVQIQGQPAAVGNGVFTGTATLHAGKTTIDVIGSAPGATPGSTSITISRQTNSPRPKKAAKKAATGGTVSPESTGGSCGGSLTVGPDTSCVFAQAVENAYRESGGSETVEAFSDATDKAYEMTCVTSNLQVTCTGGIGASVHFPE